MSGNIGPLARLLDEQAAAADPQVHAWVAASAGTGKTQVLTARVLRLLLAGARPQAILCITFTKLAAAEMQSRVMTRLAHWAGCPDAALAADLAAIGAEADAQLLARARGLFAAVLETPAGLAIQTIHSFAQGLIASFPVEAGITPGFQTLDDRAAALLRRRVLATALTDEADHGFRADVAEIAIDAGEGRLDDIMAAVARHGAALAALRVEGVEPLLRRSLGLADADSAAAAFERGIAGLPLARLQRFGQAMAQQGGGRAQGIGGEVVAFGMAANKPMAWPGFWKVFLKADGVPKSPDWMIPKALAEWLPFCAEVQEELRRVLAEMERWQILEFAARHLRVAVRLAQDMAAAKARAGVIDYDDMIDAAARLLGGEGAADWVRFKLDARIDHVLVDEAQDTNLRQWEVIRALVEEFFAGTGQREAFRSLFVVGDFKQSIFGFQGADPQIYADKKDDFHQLCEAEPERWKELALSVNFRSVPVILDGVDRVIAHIGPDQFDARGVPPHIARKAGAGTILLWPLLEQQKPVSSEEEDESDEPPPGLVIELARNIAASIAGWLGDDDPLILPGSGRRAQPQDILVLLRKRGRLMNGLVGALHEAGVPVAGVDRLNLAEPLAVADLVALVQFVLQPGDDLTLAALLVSPFCNLDHDGLTALAATRPGSLWAAVAASEDAAVQAAHAWLAAVQRLGSDVSPYRFLEAVLSGPLAGRRRLMARLGEEARDAIETVLDQALACEAAGAASLQAFLAWMAADNLEVKRDPEAAFAAVRLMTVHGAKGLQAPIVIMADAGSSLDKDHGPVLLPLDNGPDLPLWLPGGLVAPPDILATAKAERQARARLEHRRLLYVALTRAEEMLCITGIAKPDNEGNLPADCWYQMVAGALAGAGAAAVDDPHWSDPVLRLHAGPPVTVQPVKITPETTIAALDRWWDRPAPAEARPPRPLSPSSLGPDPVSAPPPDAGRRAAARRGTALHRLFELVPGLPPARRAAVARAWCQHNVPDLDADELVATMAAVLDDLEFAPVFAPGALTEAPVAAVLGEAVIAGSIDRLLVTETDVLAVDFKTGARVPAGLDAVPPAHLAQMAAYAAALAAVFPGHRVRAALLYTAGPRLIMLPEDVLSAAFSLGMLSAALPPGDAITIYPQ